MMPASETQAADQENEQGGSGTGTGTGTETSGETGTSAKTGTATKKGTKPEVKADPELGALLNTYEDAQEKATSYFVEMLDYVKKKNITRAVLVKTLMEFRKVEASTAVTQASRILTMLKDEGVVDQLRAGEISLKVARAATARTRETSATGGSAGTNEAKEKDFDNKLKAFAQAAKAMGYDLKSIMATVRATLQAEPFNIK
jgi:hypothetical protein